MTIFGLEAFKKLGKLISKFPQYNLDDNLWKLYCDKENVHAKDFIKWGTEFVGSMDTVDLAKDCLPKSNPRTTYKSSSSDSGDAHKHSGKQVQERHQVGHIALLIHRPP